MRSTPGWTQNDTPVLIEFAGLTIVRAIRELKELLLAYRGREEAIDLENFPAYAATGIDPALRVALTIALLTGGQVVAAAKKCLLHEAETRAYLAVAGNPGMEYQPERPSTRTTGSVCFSADSAIQHPTC